MLGVTKQALATWDCDAFVFDLAELTYRWGDGMLAVVSVDTDPDASPLPRTAAVSRKCRGALESLLVGGRGFLFPRLDEAIDAAAKLADEQEQLEDKYEDELKMYILIKDSVSSGFAVTAAAHASLKSYLHNSGDWAVRLWVSGIFRKVICRVTDKEFEQAKRHEDHVVITESALDNQEVALAFKPRTEWPKPFRYYQLYR